MKQADPYNSTKLQKLEEELEKARGALAAKEGKVKPELRQWERLDRESEKAALKSQLAEDGLRGLSGEDIAGAAF